MKTDIHVTEAQRKQYREEGYFILYPGIPRDHLEFLRAQCTMLIEEQNAEMDRLGTDVIDLSRRNSRYFVFLPYRKHQQLGQVIFSDLMAEICRATIGVDAMLFWEQFVVKGTDTKGAEFGWHQDSGYVDHPHKPYVNTWIPLDDVNEENGTIHILPYSSAGTRERVEHKVLPNSNDRVGYFGEDPGVPVVCREGSIAVFSSTSFHRSGANYTKQLRRSYAIQFSPEPIYEADGSLKGFGEYFLKNDRRVK